jgi:hypothetical protein
MKATAGAIRAMLREPREVIREEPLMQRPIREALADGPLTIPQIARSIGYPAEETVYWVMGMRRYGHLVELEEADDDGYFPYRAIDRETEQ